MKQKLTVHDEQTHVEMCNWFNGNMEEEDDWIINVCFGDEAHFHLDSYINSKNCISEELNHHRKKFCSAFCAAQKSQSGGQ